MTIIGLLFALDLIKSNQGDKMKPCQFLIVFLTLSLTLSVDAAQLGVLQIAGTGCDTKVGANKLTPVKGVKNRFTVPIHISEDKLASTITRKSCTFSLPVKLQQNEKIQIVNAAQTISLRATPTSKAAMQTEVFLAGQPGKLMKSEIVSTTLVAQAHKKLTLNGVVAESGCGADVILRANSSVLLTGSGSGRAVTQPLAFDLRIVRCN
jgi:Domain of unknown function (DUF4360)